jgi:hypothetical protein
MRPPDVDVTTMGATTQRRCDLSLDPEQFQCVFKVAAAPDWHSISSPYGGRMVTSHESSGSVSRKVGSEASMPRTRVAVLFLVAVGAVGCDTGESPADSPVPAAPDPAAAVRWSEKCYSCNMTLSAKALSSSTMELSWTEPQLDPYYYDGRPYFELRGSNGLDEAGISVLQENVVDLLPNTKYCFRVIAAARRTYWYEFAGDSAVACATTPP